ncbi:DUF692 domain-containing protein [Bacteriovorax sp. DB6_IX]|uniref:DUF692 domain-containing protein n=1 Tax=Bacteriovorax sp. DB6_IX TaxID=1353530 RepID=UPI000389FD39|nr:DUF692 domain-containing protein [Bacteriovorax sp. DB6_IX]EQC50470.1 PF05114 family protein [Bacteriovorax sp. DB6_IX]
MLNASGGVGINLRLEFIDEILEKKPKIDFLEIIADNWLSVGPHHKKLAALRKDYEISFHCVGMNLAGSDELSRDYLNEIKSLIQQYSPFQVSDHLSVQKYRGVCFHDLLPHPFNNKSLINMSERISYIQDFLGTEILVENLSYYHQFESSDRSEASFINELANLTGCSVLLDLNNIWVNEMNFGLSTKDFLDELNLDVVKEVHVAGAEKKGELFIDTHGSDIHPEVLNILAGLRKHLGGLPIVYERDNNLPDFSKILEQRNLIVEVLNG